MAKRCGKCEKVVYPAEELKCLDKSWHKLCFKCWECGMQLNLKNYKGFNKLPYCNAHSPQIKATTVAETPEQKRLKDITKMNSQIQYQKEYRENLGNMTSIADDPTTQRVKQLGNLTSAKYGDRVESHARTSVDHEDESGYSGPAQYDEPSDDGPTYKAMYDYDAGDSDEASIVEGDRIVNAGVIDDGWIVGTVERTGQRGLIPATYVEQI